MTSGPDESMIGEQRLVANEEPFARGVDFGGKARSAQALADRRERLAPDPFGETRADGLAPALLLASRRWQGLCISAGHEIGCEGADVVRDIDILREPADGMVGLGERRAALEHDVSPERRTEQDAQRLGRSRYPSPEERSPPTRFLRGSERLSSALSRQRLERDLSHARPACSRAPPSNAAWSPAPRRARRYPRGTSRAKGFGAPIGPRPAPTRPGPG